MLYFGDWWDRLNYSDCPHCDSESGGPRLAAASQRSAGKGLLTEMLHLSSNMPMAQLFLFPLRADGASLHEQMK